MPLSELTIKLSDPDGRVSVEALTEGLENALAALRSLENDFTVTGISVRWKVVHVSMRSPLKVRIAPFVQNEAGKSNPAIGRKISRAFMNGIATLEKATNRPQSLPPHFSEETVRAVQKMVKSAEKDGTKVTLISDKSEVALTDAAIKNSNEMISKVRRYTDVSTIEGMLEAVNAHGKTKILVWDILTRKPIECIVNQDKLNEYLQLFNKRVSVTGKVEYRNDVPKIVTEIETIKQLPGWDDLVLLEDMQPIDISGDQSPEDYVRRMRDG
jgi:hypothetical protein